MLRIKAIEIEGFRGFTENKLIEFATPMVLLYGGNHQGKSSVLNAIEWCLYGDECIGEKSGIRERVGTGESAWRIVNDNIDKAEVKLTIESNVGTFTIVRSELREKGKKGKKIKISFPNGTEKEGNDAELEIAKLLCVSFKDFATTVYQHQETIHDFVIQKPTERSDALDRLLGLSDYRNILDGIKKSEISKIQKELAGEFSKFQVRIEEAIKIRQKDIDDKTNKAKVKGLEDEELSEMKLFEFAESTMKDINEFARQLGLTISAVPTLSDWKGTESFINNIKNECNRLWAESPDVKEQSEKQWKRSKLVSLQSQYEIQFKNYKSQKKELEDFERENGNKDGIVNKIENTSREATDIEKEIRKTNSKAKLVEEGISLLEVAAASETDVCPLCGKTVPNLLEHLREEWTEKIESKVRELNNKKEVLYKRKSDFEGLLKEHDRLMQDLQREKNRLKAAIDDIMEFLGKEIGDRDDPSAILSSEIKKIDSRLKEIEDAIKSKRTKIEAILDKTDKMNLIYEISLLKNKLEEINQIQKTDLYQLQKKIKNDVSVLVGEVKDLTKIIKSCMLKEAEEKITSAKSAIDEYFLKITENPAFQKLNIRVEEDAKKGGNIYSFEDQNDKNPIPILSQGDLNSLALSIFLGLAKAGGDAHPLGFIFMDDPSQSLDSQQKERLIEAIDEISENKNIIISTMDEEFKQFLKENIKKRKTVFTFSDWMPDGGPKISGEI